MNDGEHGTLGTFYKAQHCGDCLCEYRRHFSSRETLLAEEERVNTGTFQCRTFKLTLSDVLVLRQDNPTASPNLSQPLDVCSGILEVGGMNLNSEAVNAQCIGDNLVPEASIEEEDEIARQQPLTEARSELHPQFPIVCDHNRPRARRCFHPPCSAERSPPWVSQC